MGTAERKARERQEMKELILAAATRLIVERGFEHLSMRNIAEAIEYSPATLYLYFKDKNELFYALSEEGFRRMFSYLQQLPPEGKPIDRLKALGDIYLRFAFENPAYYTVMFLMQDPMNAEQVEHQWESGMKSHQVLTTAVEACIADGHFRGFDVDQVSFMVWSMVHGLSAFPICGRMKMYDEKDHDRLIQGALAIFNRSLETL